MSEKNIKNMLGNTFMNIADAIESGYFFEKIKIGITLLGSEHGLENILKGAELAAKESNEYDIVLIGPKVKTSLELIEVNSEDEMYKKMDELLEKKYLSACVTMHYNFPIGVSTVGKIITPSRGNEMFIATTTGTSAINRTESMIRNAVYGIIVAKTMGYNNPSVGILNIDNARSVERALIELDKRGYSINFANSNRSDGGVIMRGNDLLIGSADIMVSDTLTGNIMMKMLSSFTTGGDYETLGCGYGPGIGKNYDKIILILSRASGIPVVSNAIKYAASLAKNDLMKVTKEEFNKLKNAGFEEIIDSIIENKNESSVKITIPAKEVVTASINGIDIMNLDLACDNLWKNDIYAESGMGCTGPVILISESNKEKASELLIKAGYI